MFSRKVYQWNAVDVEQDGLLPRGLIVDKLEEGWVVDFDLADNSLQTIPYGSHIYLNDKANTQWAPEDALASSQGTLSYSPYVLLKLSSSQPWTWYSCKLSPRSSHQYPYYALVEVWHEDERIVAVVKEERVRREPRARNVMEEMGILKATIPAPKNIPALTPTIVELWKSKFPGTHPVAIVDNCVTFLWRGNGKFPGENEVAAVLQRATTKTQKRSPSERKTAKSPSHRYKKKRFQSDFQNTPSLSDAEGAGCSALDDGCASLNDLPLDVLSEIFSVLDGRHKALARSVCAGWNSVVQSADCSQTVIINVDPYAAFGEYTCILWLCNCITSATKYGLFVGVDMRAVPPLLSDLRTFKELPDVFVFSDAALLSNNDRFDGFVTELEKVRTSLSQIMDAASSRFIIYKTALWHFFIPACAKTLLYGDGTKEVIPHRSQYDLMLDHVAVNVHTGIDWMDVFKRAAPPLPDFNVPRNRGILQELSKWISKANMVEKREIVTILKRWQENDNHFGPNMEWTDVAANLRANLATVHGMTFWALHHLSEAMQDDGKIWNDSEGKGDSDADDTSSSTDDDMSTDDDDSGESEDVGDD
ncbi:uncharacterized protein LOC129582899 [Paramacrobiotus metropolitanus]|uniref:uncharacterized protein LOC129582899 n=1 Tax=Paramacrobiotus metropolitanus TaxID=2943436 RepID=UPI0024462BD8|nr:uncharacterized protein LOC129582899 [Paramacrobiotus metropolitanus]